MPGTEISMTNVWSFCVLFLERSGSC